LVLEGTCKIFVENVLDEGIANIVKVLQQLLDQMLRQ
jgi:hypothetical protein